MPVRTPKNLFAGVNPLLQSWLQTGEFDASADRVSFHNAHINYIADILNTRYFSPECRYIARNTQGLQSRIWLEGELTTEHHTEIVEALQAVAVYLIENHRVWGEEVAHLELLSPTNKPGGPHYDAYRAKRGHLLETGVPLIEIDYLHETPSPVRGLPRYPTDPDSHPYYVAVSDPRPSLAEGRTRVYGFDVDQPIPTFELPLLGEDRIAFVLDEVYQHTFEVGGWGLAVDYEQSPERLDTYSQADRERIQARMAAAKGCISVLGNVWVACGSKPQAEAFKPAKGAICAEPSPFSGLTKSELAWGSKPHATAMRSPP